MQFRNPTEFRAIPEFDGIPCNSGIPGIGWRRNWTEFQELLPIPEFRAIPCNSLSTQFPEFRTGITYLSQRLIFDHNTMREGEGER